ncbi:hypothetical protein RSAG8_13774, partial [Rhizoctonia solani AG-8 WAC10335]
PYTFTSLISLRSTRYAFKSRSLVEEMLRLRPPRPPSSILPKMESLISTHPLTGTVFLPKTIKSPVLLCTSPAALLYRVGPAGDMVNPRSVFPTNHMRSATCAVVSAT